MKTLRTPLLLSVACFALLAMAIATAGWLDFIEESPENIRQRAEDGDSIAQFKLGEYYLSGEESKKDPIKAAKWFHKAAEQGHAKAKNRLNSLRNTLPPGALFQEDRRAANSGNTEAQLIVGLAFYEGIGTEKDYFQSVYWFHEAAKGGNVEAHFHIGNAYYQGKGLEENATEAAYWYCQAAKRGYAKAQFHIGRAYQRGIGVKQDYIEAKRWYRKSAEQGYIEAYLKLARLYLQDLINEWLGWTEDSVASPDDKDACDLD